MCTSSPRHHRTRRYTAPLHIKLDAAGQAALATCCAAVGRRPCRVLRQVIAWGVGNAVRWRVNRRRVPHAAQTISFGLEPEMRARLHAATRMAHGDASTWIGQVFHQMPLADLPPDWRPGTSAPKRCAICARERPLVAFRRTHRAPDEHHADGQDCAVTTIAAHLHSYDRQDQQPHRARLQGYRRRDDQRSRQRHRAPDNADMRVRNRRRRAALKQPCVSRTTSQASRRSPYACLIHATKPSAALYR